MGLEVDHEHPSRLASSFPKLPPATVYIYMYICILYICTYVALHTILGKKAMTRAQHNFHVTLSWQCAYSIGKTRLSQWALFAEAFVPSSVL